MIIFELFNTIYVLDINVQKTTIEMSFGETLNDKKDYKNEFNGKRLI